MSLPPPIELLGVMIHPVTEDDLIELLVTWGDGPTRRTVFYVNAHAMNLAYSDADFRAALNQADLVFCDGFGVKWAARLAGRPVPARMTPPDWMDRFAETATAAGQSIFALGDEPGIAAAFQRTLAEHHRGYREAGAHHGFFAQHGAENDAVIRRINESGAVHLLVGLGMPLQERWALANAGQLRVKTIIVVGALFRWLAGAEGRGPRWMTDRGLEWMTRLVRHPVRHFRRYLVGNPLFLYRVLRHRFLT